MGDFLPLFSSRARKIELDDSASVDAFARLRVSSPLSLLDAQNQYGIDNHLFDNLTAGGGGIVHLPNQSSTQLSVGTASGDRAIRQSRYQRYQAGKSQQVLCSFVMGQSKPGLVRRVGYFDDSNGIFLEQASDGVYIVRRSSTTGSVVETRVAQSDWNRNKMQGNEDPSDNADWTKAQVLAIDFEWLGVGRIRVGFFINGVIHYAHVFQHANIISTVYMTTANLPVRYEIVNTSSTSSSSTMIQICCAVLSESGRSVHSVVHQVDTDTTIKNVGGTLAPIISFRPSAVFNGISNTASAEFTDFSIFVTGNNAIHFAILFNTTLTGAAWIPQGEYNSLAEYDIAASSLSGGHYIFGGYLAAGGNKQISEGFSGLEVFLVKHLDGSLDTITLAAQSLSGAAGVLGSLLWKEHY